MSCFCRFECHSKKIIFYTDDLIGQSVQVCHVIQFHLTSFKRQQFTSGSLWRERERSEGGRGRRVRVGDGEK